MYFFLIIFSVAGIIFLIASKIVEIRTGKLSWLGNASISCDPIIRRRIGLAKAFIFKIHSVDVRNFLRAVVQNLFHIFGTVGLFVSRYYGNLKNKIKGRKVLKGGGVVSFFLKNVAESKEEDNKDQNHEL